MATAGSRAMTAASAGYSREDVLRMARVSSRQVTAWENKQLIQRRESYDFDDLRTLKALNRLREHGVSAAAVRKVLDSIRKHLGPIDQPLANLRITRDGRRITVHIAGGAMDASSGQMLLDFDSRGVEEFRPTANKLANAAAERQKDQEAERWFQRGLTLEETGAPVEEATQAYRKAIAANPDAAGALVNLGTIAFRNKRMNDAELFYSRAVQADPDYPLARFNLGNLYDEQGLVEDARTHYLEALRLNSHYADAIFNLALLCERNNELLKAIHYWHRYLKMDATSSWAQAARKQLDKLKAEVRSK